VPGETILSGMMNEKSLASGVIHAVNVYKYIKYMLKSYVMGTVIRTMALILEEK
jgi:hypothetical protein